MRWVVELKKDEKNHKSPPIPTFLRTAGKDLPEGKTVVPPKEATGHITYVLKEAEEDKVLHFFKLNKHDSFKLSLIEVMMTSLWNWALPGYTSRCDLVFEQFIKEVNEGNEVILDSESEAGEDSKEDARSYRICGCISKNVAPTGEGISITDKIKRKFNPNAHNVDMFSLSGTFTNNHTKFEDDFHRKNAIIALIKEKAYEKIYVYRYDFDMTGQDLAETNDSQLADLGFSANRRLTPSNLLEPRGEEIAVVAKEDIISLPMAVKHDPWFAPGKHRDMVGDPNDTALRPLFHWKSKKGWDEPMVGNDFRDSYTAVSKKPEFIQWKWYHYARFIFTPRAVSIAVMKSRIEMILDKDEQNFALRILSRIARWEKERQEKFKKELMKIPEFIKALYNHKKEYLEQMQKDNRLFVEKFVCPLDLEKIEQEMGTKYELFLQQTLDNQGAHISEEKQPILSAKTPPLREDYFEYDSSIIALLSDDEKDIEIKILQQKTIQELELKGRSRAAVEHIVEESTWKLTSYGERDKVNLAISAIQKKADICIEKIEFKIISVFLYALIVSNQHLLRSGIGKRFRPLLMNMSTNRTIEAAKIAIKQTLDSISKNKDSNVSSEELQEKLNEIDQIALERLGDIQISSKIIVEKSITEEKLTDSKASPPSSRSSENSKTPPRFEDLDELFDFGTPSTPKDSDLVGDTPPSRQEILLSPLFTPDKEVNRNSTFATPSVTPKKNTLQHIGKLNQPGGQQVISPLTFPS